MRRTGILSGALTLALWLTSSFLLAPSGQAQQANFGTVSLAPGFMPDPRAEQGTSGGQAEAQRLNSGCRGFIASNPDHLFNAQGSFRFLRVFAVSAQDTTLVIQTPDGQLRCNDDAFGRNPSVEGPWPAGTYRIWVGSYTRGTQAPYQLYFSELANTTPATVFAPVQAVAPVAPAPSAGETPGSTATGPDLRRLDRQSGRSNFQGAWLQSGFMPDPNTVTGTSGGTVAARRVATGCAGYIARRPDHVLNLEGAFNFFRVTATSAQDTTLVVLAPDGTWYCNDDTVGTNPEVRRNHWSPGQYLLWVGSYRQGQNASYQLAFSELRSGEASGPVVQPAPVAVPVLDPWATRSNFQDAWLRAGFTPDPHRLAGTSGGQISASSLSPDCRGWVARSPDHALNLQTATGFFRIFASSASDTTLVVRAPDGRWLCDDDTFGRNPAVEGERWAPGRYLIWVGSYAQTENAPYTLNFTELRGVTP